MLFARITLRRTAIGPVYGHTSRSYVCDPMPGIASDSLWFRLANMNKAKLMAANLDVKVRVTACAEKVITPLARLIVALTILGQC